MHIKLTVDIKLGTAYKFHYAQLIGCTVINSHIDFNHPVIALK